jgi:hypothetical protein
MILPENMTLNQAAKVTGKSKGTISKALKEGRLSYLSKDESGYKIDPSELNRVFPLNTSKVNAGYQISPPIEHQENTFKIRELELLLSVEKKEKIIYQSQLQEKDITIDDYRTRLTKAEDTIHRQTLLLADDRIKKPVESDKTILATSLPKNRFRLSSGQFWGFLGPITLLALGVLFWPDIISRLTR